MNQNKIDPFPIVKYEIQWYPVEWICIAPFFINGDKPPGGCRGKRQRKIQKYLYDKTGLWFVYEPLHDGSHPWRIDLSTTPTQKLQYITDYKHLRLYIWKQHNAVNSSIWRKEFWYHFTPEPRGLPTRWFPNLQEEVFMAQNFTKKKLSNQLVSQLTNLSNVSCNLQSFRQQLINLYINGINIDSLFNNNGNFIDLKKLEQITQPIKVLNSKLRESINYLDNYFFEYKIDKLYDFKVNSQNCNPSPRYFQKNGSKIRSCSGNFITNSVEY